MHSGRTHAGVDPQLADPQAVRSSKLELIERIADDLAHEIKNPLHSMVINLEVLKRRIGRAGGSPPDELLRYTGILGNELDRVSRRVDLLLRLIRPDRGGDPTTLDAILEELLELLELERDRRKMTVRYEPAQVPVRGHLPLDPARQLVLAILVEVVELVPTGGTLRLRTEMEPAAARLRLEAAAPHPEAVDAAALQEELLARLAATRGVAEGLGGHLEVSARLPGDPECAADAVLCVTLSLPLSLSAG